MTPPGRPLKRRWRNPCTERSPLINLPFHTISGSNPEHRVVKTHLGVCPQSRADAQVGPYGVIPEVPSGHWIGSKRSLSQPDWSSQALLFRAFRRYYNETGDSLERTHEQPMPGCVLNRTGAQERFLTDLACRRLAPGMNTKTNCGVLRPLRSWTDG